MSSRDKDHDHDFEPYDGTPGKKWDDFKQRLMDYAAGKTDDRGESLADFYLDQSEGQAGGAALPAGAAEVRKAQLALRRRQKDAYALLMRHIAHADHKLHMSINHFQDGLAAYQYIEAASAAPMNAIQLRKLRPVSYTHLTLPTICSV